VAVGAAHDNAAIVGARRVRSGNTERVFVDVRAFASGALRTRVEVRARAGEGGAGAVLGSNEVAVDPDRTAHLSLEVAAGDAPLEVALSPDAFAADDAAVLLPEPSPSVPVEVALAAAAADALELDRALEAAGGTRRAGSTAEARLRFSAQPEEGFPGTQVLLAAPSGEGESDAWVGPFLVERDPLTRGLTLEGVVWTAGRTDPPGAPLVVAGERTLVSVEAGARGTRVWLNLDPERSNLPRSPDWPILVANLVEAARAALPGASARNLRTGQEVVWRGVRADESLSLALLSPRGRRRPASGLGEVTWRPEEPGVHALVDENGREVARFAVQFVDPAESDLRVRVRADEPPEVPAGPASAAGGAAVTRGRGRTEAAVLGLLLLLALAADWWALARRSGPRGARA
jgi:hypothetical protein